MSQRDAAAWAVAVSVTHATTAKRSGSPSSERRSLSKQAQLIEEGVRQLELLARRFPPGGPVVLQGLTIPNGHCVVGRTAPESGALSLDVPQRRDSSVDSNEAGPADC